MSKIEDTEVVAEPPAAVRVSGSETQGLLIGYLSAALGAALFSTKAIIIKLAYEVGIAPETLLALRMVLALPFYFAIGAISIRERLQSGRDLPPRALVLKAAAIGALGYWFASYTDFLGLVHISAQFERLILFTYPAFVVLLGALFFAQPIRARAVAGIGISYAGLAVIFATKLSTLGGDVARGAGFVLAAAIAFAFYQLLAKGMIGRIGPRLFTCIAMSGAAAAVLLQFALTEPLSSLIVSKRLFSYGLLLAVGSTVLPSFLLNAALHRISAQANSMIGTLSPVITILLAVVILGEPFTALDAAGTALVLAGVAWFTLGGQRG